MISFTGFTQADLKEESLARLNEHLRQLTLEVNRLGGWYGRISVQNGFDLGGNTIQNVGDAQSDTDVLTKTAADPVFGKAVIQQQMEAVGSSMLQTARRLNDPTQQETVSSFLNIQGSIPPASNTSTPTVTSIGGGQSQIAWPAGTVPLADGTHYTYAARTDTVTDPGAGSNFYYYYLRISDQTLQFIGPFTANNSNNSFNANLDGRMFVGTAQVNAGGGGGASGGGGDSGGGAGSGCVEIGTPVSYYPMTSSVQEQPEACENWALLRLKDGRKLSMHPDTLVTVFVRARDLEEGMRVEVDTGNWCEVGSLVLEQRKSVKIKRIVEPWGVYMANGIRLHNFKPLV